MKKILSKGLLLISLFFGVCASDAIQPQKPWTVLVYMAAANDLNPYALLDLQEMMRVGSNDNVNILVYLTLQQDGEEKVTKQLYINKGSMTQVGPDMIRDSGSVETLKEALEWAFVRYPSDHKAIIFWDHGSGDLNRFKKQLSHRGVCYDYDTGNYLTDKDCIDALNWARVTFFKLKRFDIIAFDACLMASLAMAYTLSFNANYMVASQETIPGDGYQYAYLLSPFTKGTLDPLAFAKNMVSAYKQEYTGTLDYTLSATDLREVQSLVYNSNAISDVLTTQLKGKDKTIVKSTIKKCVSSLNCLSFDDGNYIDLCQFYKNLLKNISGLKLSSAMATQFKNTLNTAINLFPTVVKANVKSINYSQANGLSMYFGRYAIEPSYYNLIWTKENPQWLNFLQAYLA